MPLHVDDCRRSAFHFWVTDGAQRFDANVLSCTYNNGRGEVIQLTNDDGCATRPDLTTPFYKIRETNNPNSELTLYTYFRVPEVANNSRS